MNPNVQEKFPLIEALDFGLKAPDTDGVIMRYDREPNLDADLGASGYHDGRLGPLFGLIENVSDTAFDVVLEDSDDNGDADAYAAVNMRIGGSNVASITVVPGGKVVFTVEASLKKFFRFRADPVSAWGRLTFCRFGGALRRVERDA